MTPKLNSYILGVQMSRGLLAFIHSSAPADLHREKGALRDRDRCDFQGPSPEREEGQLPCPAPGDLRLLQAAAARQNVRGRLPPCLCESQKNKPSDFRLL